MSRHGLAIVIASMIAALVSIAATWPRFHTDAADEPQLALAEAASGGAPGTASSNGGNTPSLLSDFTSLLGDNDLRPWSRLTDAERTALAPFATQWDSFSATRKRKWLHIAAHYPKMSTHAQQRLHAQMTAWVNMTPEQRRIARENYQISKRLPLQTRQSAWANYQRLSARQKAKLAASMHRHRHTIISAPPTSGSHDINRLMGHDNHGIPPSLTPPPAGTSPSQPLSGIYQGS